jgi:hypothetical protein
MNPAGTNPRNASSGNRIQISVYLRAAVIGRGNYIVTIDTVVSNSSQQNGCAEEIC